MTTIAATSGRPVVRVTEIGEYIRLQSCERRFKLDINHRAEARALPFAERLFNPLDPVLQESGHQRETQWEESLVKAAYQQLSADPPTGDGIETAWADFVAKAAAVAAGQPGFGREVAVSGDLGAFHVEGRADFVLILWTDGRPHIRLVEGKASRRDRTYHRIQVVLYRLLVRQLLHESPLIIAGATVCPEDVECVVARIDEATGEAQALLALEPLDLEMEEADVLRLLAPDGALARIIGVDLDDLSYQLDEKCDGCVFGVHCLPESARQRRLELLSIPPSTARELRESDIITIDDLAELDLAGAEAAAVRSDPSFGEHLALLIQKARARRRTLPGGDADPDAYVAMPLPHAPRAQIPEHEINGQRLVRVYLAVDYDYGENRIGALTAHVTTSEGQLHTGFVEEHGRWQPDPIVRERVVTGQDPSGRPTYGYDPLQGQDIVELMPTEWTGRYEVDSGAEKLLIQSFLMKLVDAIAAEAAAEEAPIHFYVWSRGEMTRLVEACSRVSSRLLGHLRELLGCRESLEQLIYSCLQDEVDRRFGLGWTGRGLVVASSLQWFGRRYHWRRRVAGVELDLDHELEQDLFDFKTSLRLLPSGEWADPDDLSAPRHRFEVRSRFHDSLPAPYWRAFWRTLPDPAKLGHSDAQLAQAIRRYNRAAKPGHLSAYLRARAHALRWMEEGIRFKNPEIDKPLLRIEDLPTFRLGVDSVAAAAIDFLQLDQHVKVTDWIAEHLVPPATRAPTGRTLPLGSLVAVSDKEIRATIDLTGYDIGLDALEARSTIAEGSFVRLSPCFADPDRGQTIRQLTAGGKTCRVESINWRTGEVRLSPLWQKPTRYVLQSSGVRAGEPVFDYATLDESVSDFVAGRVDERLTNQASHPVYQWLDPESPRVPAQDPPSALELNGYRYLLETLALADGHSMSTDQIQAVLEGLSARVQLLQGPPGTGKTTTTSVSTLLRALARRAPGDVVLIAANTHTAVDTLLERLEDLLPPFAAHARSQGYRMPAVRLAKAVSSATDAVPGKGIQRVVYGVPITTVQTLRSNGVLIVGGTTAAILRLANKLDTSPAFQHTTGGFRVPMLIVDEASMLVFPHFLALATTLAPDGEVLLAGDHRQLAPIIAHDWEREDRPPAVLYQPFASAYQAVRNITHNPTVTRASVTCSALSFTFRLPPEIRDLIARLYRLDDIELDGLARGEVAAPATRGACGTWERVWQGETGLFLVMHGERESRQSNPTEAVIVEQILAAAPPQPTGSVAIVTPHRAQRSLLKTLLARFAGPIDAIDTVERLQGGERDTVIVSATGSDPAAIAANVEFILDLTRSNVAFSRSKKRLVVVCAETLLDYIPAEVEDYESAMLWKSLREICSRQIAEVHVHAHRVRIFTPPVSAPDSPVSLLG